ncbi:MAG: hemolysin III family protein [Erysipelotrichaceae bacterium]|nr:hemolysin III family protein [Erysipelotrichaceae bacterium]
MKHIKIPNYTLGEELINSISHGIGAALSIAALVLLIIRSNTLMGLLTSLVYAISLILLYTISCIYHALSPRLVGKKVLRVLDHCNVLLLEAGTYTPICLCLFSSPLSWIMFGIVWGITLIAIIFNAMDVDRYQGVSVACNLILGWAILFVIHPLINSCAIRGVVYLILGGVMYSIGAILYGIGAKKRYMHSVFHFFVLAGSLFHFFMIYFYVI